MSQENVEIVRGIYDAVARRDGVTPFEAYAEDIVWDLSNSRRTALGVEPIYRGHEGVRKFWRDALSVFGQVDLDVEELIDAGDQVVAVTRERGVGRGSGVLVRAIAVSVWTLENGKVIQVQVFDDRRQALEAAGLREEAMSRNVELVRHTIELANRRDLDALDDLATADYEWHNAPGFPGGGVHRGREAVKAHLREFFETWETYTVEEESVIDAGEQVVQLCQLHVTGKGSGVTLDIPIAWVHTLRDGKFARTMAFIHHADALEAAGLRE